MKNLCHPKAKNQYAGRAFTKLSKEGREAHRETMKAFVKRLRTLNK